MSRRLTKKLVRVPDIAHHPFSEVIEGCKDLLVLLPSLEVGMVCGRSYAMGVPAVAMQFGRRVVIVEASRVQSIINPDAVYAVVTYTRKRVGGYGHDLSEPVPLQPLVDGLANTHTLIHELSWSALKKEELTRFILLGLHHR